MVMSVGVVVVEVVLGGGTELWFVFMVCSMPFTLDEGILTLNSTIDVARIKVLMLPSRWIFFFFFILWRKASTKRFHGTYMIPLFETTHTHILNPH